MKRNIFYKGILTAFAISVVSFAGVEAADRYRPTLDDFYWYTEEVKQNENPEVDYYIDGYDEITGEWKAMVDIDIMGDPDITSVVLLCNMTLDGDFGDAELVVDWYERYFMPQSSCYNEENQSDSVFYGSAGGNGISFTGSGNILLTDFYVNDGYEFGLGTYQSPSGEHGTVALVREKEDTPSPVVEETSTNQPAEVSVEITEEVEINQNSSQALYSLTEENNTTIINNSVTSFDIFLPSTISVNMNYEITSLTQYFITHITEYKESFENLLLGFLNTYTQEWSLFPKTGIYEADPVKLYTRLSELSVALREFALENPQKPYALLITGDVDFERIPAGLTDAVYTEKGIFYPVTTGSRYILEFYNSFEEASREEQGCTYPVITLVAPPSPEVHTTTSSIKVTLPEPSFAMENGLVDGYRLTVWSNDGKETHLLYKASAAGKEKELLASELAYAEEITSSVAFAVSVCEFVQDADGTRYFGPESADDVDDMISETPQPEDTGLLDERLEEESAIEGDITVSMIWATEDDLDLHLNTPEGEIYYSNRTTEHGELDVDMQTSSNMVEHPVENIYVNDPPRGEYKVWVDNYADRTPDSDADVLVRVTVNGQQQVYNLRMGDDTDVVSFTY